MKNKIMEHDLGGVGKRCVQDEKSFTLIEREDIINDFINLTHLSGMARGSLELYLNGRIGKGILLIDPQREYKNQRRIPPSAYRGGGILRQTPDMLKNVLRMRHLKMNERQ